MNQPSDEEDYDIQNNEIKLLLNDIANVLGPSMPEGWGFCLYVFTFGSEGSMFYVSNAERSTMIQALQEFIREQKSRGH